MPNIVRRIDPETDDLYRLVAMPTGTLATMLNSLLRFRTQATYAADISIESCSGRGVYARYSRTAQGQIKTIGGKVAWTGTALNAFIAPPGKHRDEMLLVTTSRWGFPAHADTAGSSRHYSSAYCGAGRRTAGRYPHAGCKLRPT